MKIDIKKLSPLLQEPIRPVGNYVFTKRVGDLIYTSGIIPLNNGKLLYSGKVGQEVSLEEGQACAKQCVLNALSLLMEMLDGSMNHLEEIISLRVIVASTADYTDHAKVANGASDFLVDILGESGKHTRAALGVNSLPLDAPVEIEFVFRISS